MTELDHIDRQILALLSNNARLSNKELAHAVNLSPSSVHERTRKLFESGILAGTHADVRLDLMGLPLKALLFIQMSEHEKSNLDRFIQDIIQIPEVRAAWMITGRFDAIVELVSKDTVHLHRIVVEQFSSREEIHRIETSIIFEQAQRNDLSATLELLD